MADYTLDQWIEFGVEAIAEGVDPDTVASEIARQGGYTETDVRAVLGQYMPQEPEEPGFLENVGGLLSHGLEQTKTSLKAGLAARSGKQEDIDAAAEAMAASARDTYQKPKRLEEMMTAVGAHGIEMGEAFESGEYTKMLPALGGIAWEVISDPEAAAYMFSEQASNIAATWFPGWVGGRAGGLLGSRAGPKGAAVGGATGAIGGQMFGEYMVEAGAKINEEVVRRAGPNPTAADFAEVLEDPKIRAEIRQMGHDKGFTITVADGLANLFSMQVMKPAIKASRAAKALDRPSLAPGRGEMLARTGAAQTAQLAGAGIGEGYGEYRASGEVDWEGVAQEMALDVVSGAGDIAVSTVGSTSGRTFEEEEARFLEQMDRDSARLQSEAIRFKSFTPVDDGRTPPPDTPQGPSGAPTQLDLDLGTQAQLPLDLEPERTTTDGDHPRRREGDTPLPEQKGLISPQLSMDLEGEATAAAPQVDENQLPLDFTGERTTAPKTTTRPKRRAAEQLDLDLGTQAQLPLDLEPERTTTDGDHPRRRKGDTPLPERRGLLSSQLPMDLEGEATAAAPQVDENQLPLDFTGERTTAPKTAAPKPKRKAAEQLDLDLGTQTQLPMDLDPDGPATDKDHPRRREDDTPLPEQSPLLSPQLALDLEGEATTATESQVDENQLPLDFTGEQTRLAAQRAEQEQAAKVASVRYDNKTAAQQARISQGLRDYEPVKEGGKWVLRPSPQRSLDLSPPKPRPAPSTRAPRERIVRELSKLPTAKLRAAMKASGLVGASTKPTEQLIEEAADLRDAHDTLVEMGVKTLKDIEDAVSRGDITAKQLHNWLRGTRTKRQNAGGEMQTSVAARELAQWVNSHSKLNIDTETAQAAPQTGKSPADVEISQRVIVEETGEEHMVLRKGSDVLAEADQRIENLHALRDCLG